MEQAVTFPLVTIHYMYIYAYILKDRRLHHSGVVVIGIEAVFTYTIFTITFFTASVIRLLTIISDSLLKCDHSPNEYSLYSLRSLENSS